MINKKQLHGEQQERDQAFINRLSQKAKPKDAIREARKGSNFLKKVSLICNVISILAAIYFVIYITGDYSGWKKWVPLILGVAVLVAIEYGKRFFSILGFERAFNPEQGGALLRFLPLGVLIPASIYLSYSGGDKFVIEESAAPAVVYNLERDSVKQMIAANNAEIAVWKKQTWKGKMVREARQTIQRYENRNDKLLERLGQLEQRDEAANMQNQSSQTARLEQWGVVFGSIAGLMDLLLLLFLGRAEWLEARAILILKNQGIIADFDGGDFENITGIRKRQAAPTPSPEPEKKETGEDNISFDFSPNDNGRAGN